MMKEMVVELIAIADRRRWLLGNNQRGYDARFKDKETAMSSPCRRMGNPARYDVMFWLPPGGIDNEVFATYWAELADLDASDVGPVLDRLAHAGVGGYVATPGGTLSRNLRRRPIRRLWVDSLQYHRAEDVLMTYLNDKSATGEI